jgi:hypothetical protein
MESIQIFLKKFNELKTSDEIEKILIIPIGNYKYKFQLSYDNINKIYKIFYPIQRFHI